MTTFNTTQTIGEIVTMMPRAGEVFKEYQIDFCCGGHRPLQEAITAQGLPEKEVLSKLEQAYAETKVSRERNDFANMPLDKLVEYILNTHHVFMKQILPELSELTMTVLRAHGTNHNELFQVHKLFHNLKTEIEQHLMKEEEILFPMITRYTQTESRPLLGQLLAEVTRTENEHDTAGDVLKELRIVTDQYTVPQDGCPSYQLAYAKFQQLEADLFQHIHLENNVLFKKLKEES